MNLREIKNLNLMQREAELKAKLGAGLITLAEAEEELKPYLDEANRRGELIAKRYKRKYKPITFTQLMR
jgi:hypothetical protein